MTPKNVSTSGDSNTSEGVMDVPENGFRHLWATLGGVSGTLWLEM